MLYGKTPIVHVSVIENNLIRSEVSVEVVAVEIECVGRRAASGTPVPVSLEQVAARRAGPVSVRRPCAAGCERGKCGRELS